MVGSKVNTMTPIPNDGNMLTAVVLSYRSLFLAIFFVRTELVQVISLTAVPCVSPKLLEPLVLFVSFVPLVLLVLFVPLVPLVPLVLLVLSVLFAFAGTIVFVMTSILSL